MTIEQILEILENYKLRIPPTVFYELKADIVNFEEPTTRNCFGCKHSKDNHNAGTEECHLCMWENQYTPTTKNDLVVDCISRDSAIKALDYDIKCFEFKSGVSEYMDDIAKLLDTIYEIQVNNIKAMPSVTPQEPRCKDCKWWKDSDGEYRRGCGAESQCPMNRREVYEGNGYCFLFEPQESEET